MLGILLGVYFLIPGGEGGTQLGSYRATSTAISVEVGNDGNATTSLIAGSENLEYFYMSNKGNGQIYCVSLTNATTGIGYHLYENGSSTQTFLELRQPDLALRQGLNCITTVTSSVSVYKY